MVSRPPSPSTPATFRSSTTHNARLVDGAQVYDGALKVVGDTVDQSDAEPDQAAFDIETEPVVTYELLCRRHWTRGEATP